MSLFQSNPRQHRCTIKSLNTKLRTLTVALCRFERLTRAVLWQGTSLMDREQAVCPTKPITLVAADFFGVAAIGAAASQSLACHSVRECAVRQLEPSPPRSPPRQAGTSASFGPLKQVNAGLLNVGYAEAGPADGPPVILLHGWPYDIHSFVDVARCWRRQATG